MPAVYDNWERLVSAVNKREDWNKSACRHSRNPSSLSSGSSDSDLSLTSMSERNETAFEFFDQPFDLLPDEQKYIIQERNGKMCYMAGARQLLILTRTASQFWGWTTRDDSRFSEVTVLHYGRSLDIRGRIKTRLLSPDTSYAAYLVFKLTEWSKGLQNVEAVVNFFDEESDRDAQERAHSVYLQHNRAQLGSFAARRADGWMEVEIGNFYVDGQDKAVEARILEYNSWKAGLIVEGIEFRPLAFGGSPFSSKGGYHLVPFESPKVDSMQFPMTFPPHYFGRDEPSEVDEAIKVPQKEDSRDIDLDMSLLHELLDSETKCPPPQTSTLNFRVEENDIKRMKPHNGLESNSEVIQAVDQFTESRSGLENGNKSILDPALHTEKENSLQDYGVGEDMIAKLLLPQDESLPASFSRDELFSGGFNRLSELVNIFHSMKRMIEHKYMEADDLKQKLLKSEIEAQLALAAKDSELEELSKKVRILKVEAVKAHQYRQEEKNKSDEKIREVERKHEDCEARATSAVEEYKNSNELKVDKHKFASKAFFMGFQFCVKQVLEVDPSFDTSRIDVKCLEGTPSSIVKM